MFGNSLAWVIGFIPKRLTQWQIWERRKWKEAGDWKQLSSTPVFEFANILLVLLMTAVLFIIP